MNRKKTVYRRKHKPKRGSNLTVCIAAIADNGTIIGAVDTMLTAADIEYEPKIQGIVPSKIRPITTSIVGLIAGDTALQAEIFLQYIPPLVDEWVKNNPNRWLPVEEAVQFYCDSYNIIRHKKAEQAVLKPFGLTYERFLSEQKQLAPDFVTKTTRALADFSNNFAATNETETIIAGVNESNVPGHTRSRIYTLRCDDYVCHDVVGFAAVGAGSRHANSHFMFTGHSRSMSISETLLSVYTAKKKAEVAPGVGSDTGMFVVGPALGTFQWMLPPVQEALDKEYISKTKADAAAAKKANIRVNKFLNELVEKTKAAKSQSDQDKPPPEEKPV